MFNGRIIYKGHIPTAQAYVGEAKQAAFSLQERLKSAGLSAGSERLTLPDGTKIHALQLPHMRQITITTTHGKDELFEYLPILDFYSGVVVGGMLNTAGKLSEIFEYGETTEEEDIPKITKLYVFHPDTTTVNRFTPPPEDTDPKPPYFALDQLQKPTKLAVELDMAFQTYPSVIPMNAPQGAARSQHMYLKPSLYYGEMRKLAQFVLGLGKQARPTWPEIMKFVAYDKEVHGNTPPIANLTKWYDEYGKEYFEGTEGVTLQYDFRFNNSQGLVWAKGQNGARERWVVRIDQALGVIAMPLPLCPGTEDLQDATGKTYNTFADTLKAAKVEDETLAIDDYLRAVEEFGGIPTGEGFDKHTEAWVRAGRYIKLAPISELAEYSSSTVWGSQIGWAFNYSGTGADVVAYEDIDKGVIDTKWAVLRAVRHMHLDFEITLKGPLHEYETFSSPAHAQIESLILPHADLEKKPWLQYKIKFLSEDTAKTLLESVATLNNGVWSLGEPAHAVDALEMAEAEPIASGSASLSVVGAWGFTPPKALFKYADLAYDMCSSVWPAANTIYVDSDDFPSPADGEEVPLYVWYNGDDLKSIKFNAGRDREYTQNNQNGTSEKVKYRSLSACCYVDNVPYEQNAKDTYPTDYYEYMGGTVFYRVLQVWAGNDTTPEVYAQANWGMRRNVTGRDDGGPWRERIEYGTAYMVLGDNEAGVECVYHHKPSIPDHTNTYQLGVYNNVQSYDFTWDNAQQSSATTQCYYGSPGYVYCNLPDRSANMFMKIGSWVNVFMANKEGKSLVLGVDEGHWSSPGQKCEYLTSPAPEVPGPETVQGDDETYSYLKTTIITTAGSQETKRDNTYVPRSRAWLDILELQPSLFNPPPESPFVEHEVRGTAAGGFDAKCAFVMKGVNDYTVVQFGSQPVSGVDPTDQACFVGYVPDGT